MRYLLVVVSICVSMVVSAQSKFSKHELSINGFRNPSIGVEYRYKTVSVSAGYYPTNFEKNTTTEFVRIGVSYWFLPIGHRENPSSFYVSASYARGTSRDYKDVNAVMGEVGFRWMVYKGLNLRLGVAALAAKDHVLHINPTPGISYSFFFN